MEEMNAAVNAATSSTVKLWLNWMLFIFFTALIFVWKHKAARIVFVTFLLTLPLALLIFNFTKSVHLIGIAHIIMWGPLAYYLLRTEIQHTTYKLKSFYGVWVALLTITITISLIFDIRDVTLVLLGIK